jgi:hypothetical protein
VIIKVAVFIIFSFKHIQVLFPKLSLLVAPTFQLKCNKPLGLFSFILFEKIYSPRA